MRVFLWDIHIIVPHIEFITLLLMLLKNQQTLFFDEHNSMEIVVEYDDDRDKIKIKIPSTSNEVNNELTFTKDHPKEFVIGTPSKVL